MKKALFLDRDGVVNSLVYYQEHGIVDSPFTPSQIKVFPWVPEALIKAHNMGFTVVLVSNQPGIAKGFFKEKTFKEIQKEMYSQLNGAKTVLAGEYYCFHHPDAKVSKYRAVCECRKPKPGLIHQAARELDLDVTKSWMLGDGITDVEAGKRAGCSTILIGKMKCEICTELTERGIKPDFVAVNLIEAVSIMGREA